jgi:uncharacterized delta-60 repeat protein
VVGSVGGDFALWRYTHSGETDESFGTGGQKVVPLGAYVSLANAALQTDGKIVLAGILDDDFVIARVLPNGELDPDFGKDGSGKVITDIGAFDIPWAVAIQGY